jgi:transgelin
MLAQADKYDPSSEHEAISWIEAVTGVSPLVPEGGTLASALRTGEVLCRLVNKIRPESVKRINVSKMPFKQMENISAFLK